jgi:Flp pilus assembly pilin Flp
MKKLMHRAYAEYFILRGKLRDLVADKRGVTMIEYSILLAIITAATIAIVIAVGGKVLAAWTTINGAWS